MFYFSGWHNLNNGRSGTESIQFLMVSYNKLRHRKSSFPLNNWIIDCGFRVLLEGKYYPSTRKYSELIIEWKDKGNLIGASCQDYPVFDEFLKITGLDVKAHQAITLKRYRSIKKYVGKSSNPPYIIPILQGRSPEGYLEHLAMYGDDIKAGDLVGVGSLKYQSEGYIKSVLWAIRLAAPSLKLHGFGLTKKQITPEIKGLLYSADSSAAAFSRDKGERKYSNSHNPDNAVRYANQILNLPKQMCIFDCDY